MWRIGRLSLLFVKSTGQQKGDFYEKRVLSLVLAFVMIFCMIVYLPPKQKASAAGAIYWPVPGHTTRSQRWHGGNAIDISDGSIGGADVIAACGGTVCAIFLCPTQHYPEDND